MSDLKEKFEQKADEVTELSNEPDNQTKLDLYALYKQATKGDVQGSQPSKLKFRERAKWDAWKEREGMDEDEAMQKYIDLVEELQD